MKYCESCSTEALPFNKAFNKDFKPREGKHQFCPGDKRLHGHGMVHVRGGGLKWVCDSCYKIIEAQWQEKKIA